MPKDHVISVDVLYKNSHGRFVNIDHSFAMCVTLQQMYDFLKVAYPDLISVKVMFD